MGEEVDLKQQLNIASYDAVLKTRRYERFGNIQDLESAIQTGRWVLERTSERDENLVQRLNNFGVMVGHRYERTGNIENLEEAIRAARQVIEVTPAGHPDLAGRLYNLGMNLGRRYARIGQLENLEEAIQVARQAVDITPAGHQDYAAWLQNLANQLGRRYESTDRTEDLQESVQLARQAINITPADNPRLSGWLNNLGIKLGRRYERTGNTDDLQEAVMVIRRALEAIPADHPAFVGTLNNLGSQLRRQYERTGNIEYLEEAICTARRVVEVTPAGHSHLAAWLTNLANSLQRRYEYTGKMGDLEEAIRMAQQAVEITSTDDPHLAGCLSNLGNKLERRYERTGKIEDLEEAIRVVRQAIETTPANHTDLAGRLHNLSNELGRRFERTGKIEDLEEAIRVVQRAIRITSADHPGLAAWMINLGNKLEGRYVHTGKTEDLEEAIRVVRQAIEVVPSDYPELAVWLNNLGTKLGLRYERTGKIEDLEEAIQVTRRAVQATPADHLDLAGILNNLGIRLESRYERTGKAGDLEEAIHVMRQAIKLSPSDHPALAVWMNNLANELGRRHERTRKIEDLEEAIKLAQRTLEITPVDHPSLARALNNLGTKLETRYGLKGKRDDLEEAIRVAQRAVEITPAHHPSLATWMGNLSAKIGRRYERTGNMDDLEEAIRLAQQAVEITPIDHPDLARTLNNLGKMFMLKNQYDKSNPLNIYLRAWNCHNAGPFIRLRASSNAIPLLQRQRRFQEAYELSLEALDILPLVHNRSLSYQDQQYVVSNFTGFANSACSLALQTGQSPESALEVLEKGRAIILRLLMDDRSDTSALRTALPELCDRYESLILEVNTSISSIIDARLRNAAIERRSEANKELTDCIQQIRENPGFNQFHKGPDSAEMRVAAIYGPVVVVNTTDLRSDAIIVEQHQLRALQLPKIKKSDIEAKIREGSLGSAEILEWLWERVACPVLEALHFTNHPSEENWPHIWWIPTGPLSQFPLHAAGYHSKRSNETVLDRVMSSYSTSIRSIIHSRGRTSRATQPSQALMVAMENTPEHSRLPFATKEVAVLHEVCKSMMFDTIQPRPNKREVTSHISQCQIFHFAGHGYTDNLDPSNSHLLLEDGKSDPLAVSNMMEMNIRESSPFLAYLSACGTGRIRVERLFDENIHLISAFQLAGFRHVIGTLWEVNDELCVDMARITYERMKDGGLTDESVCRGLHIATRKLRDRWFNMSAQAERRNRSAREDVVPEQDQDGARNVSVGHERDAAFVDDQDPGSLLWVPYVHFGV